MEALFQYNLEDIAMIFIIMSWPFVYWAFKRQQWRRLINGYLLSVAFYSAAYFYTDSHQFSLFDSIYLGVLPVSVLYLMNWIGSKYIDLSIKED